MMKANANLSSLLQMIDLVPSEHRNWDSEIIGYHISDVDNLKNIKENGLVAYSSNQSYDRPECVYLFLDNEIPIKNIPVLLGDVEQYLLIQVKFPKEDIKKLKFDGLYNVSFDFGYGAAMYFDNLPADYITDIQILDNTYLKENYNSKRGK